jgi:hypothetical protein
MIYPGEGKKGQPKAGDYVLAAEQTRAGESAPKHGVWGQPVQIIWSAEAEEIEGDL